MSRRAPMDPTEPAIGLWNHITIHALVRHAGGMEGRVEALEEAYHAFSGFLQEALGVEAGWTPEWSRGAVEGVLTLVPHVPGIREQTAERLTELLGEVLAADDPYDRLFAFGAFRTELGHALARSRAIGARRLAQALLLLRNAVWDIRAERLQPAELEAVGAVLRVIRSHDPEPEDIALIDETLQSAGLDWIPEVEAEGGAT